MISVEEGVCAKGVQGRCYVCVRGRVLLCNDFNTSVRWQLVACILTHHGLLDETKVSRRIESKDQSGVTCVYSVNCVQIQSVHLL